MMRAEVFENFKRLIEDRFSLSDRFLNFHRTNFGAARQRADL